MAELIIFSGKLKGQKLVIPDREVIVGRDEDCHMRISSSLISRKHCSLRGTPNGIWVRDLESQNGTYVNDVAVTEPYLMKPGDVLRVGASLFQMPRPRPPQPKNDADGGLSDDDISSWLTDDGQTESSSVPDTTVIKGRHPAAASSATESPSVSAATQPPAVRAVPVIRQPPKTVKEQAAEIIRRHWEIVRGGQTE